MSSIRKAAPRRTHRERAQPAARARLGILEKHSDYVERAKDFHKKQNAVRVLRSKAAARNPDEFYFGMVNAKTKGGVHVATRRSEKYDHDTLTLLKTQDQNYINYQRSVNLKKLERLKDTVHFIDNDEADDMDDDDSDSGRSRKKRAKKTDDSDSGKSSHVVFVDDEEEVKLFDPVKHFDTVPDLVNKPALRLRKSTLESQEIARPSKKVIKNMAKARAAAAAELASRMKRESKLRTAQMELDMQKNLMGKGARRKVGKDERGLAVYKWRARRQK